MGFDLIVRFLEDSWMFCGILMVCCFRSMFLLYFCICFHDFFFFNEFFLYVIVHTVDLLFLFGKFGGLEMLRLLC